MLFLIESRTGQLASRARQARSLLLSDDAARHRDLAFLDAFVRRREPPFPVGIHELERYVAHWAALVPANPRVRAQLAHFLGSKYGFTADVVPGIRAAIGLDDEAVARAYEQLHGRPLTSVYAPDLPPAGRMRWLWTRFGAWLDALPPMWSAYVLSLTETVGSGIVALPIALAGVGPLAGVVILVVLGLVNIVTAACMAEAVARSGSVRYGSAYIGTMVHDYLGRAGSLALTAALLVLTAIVVVANNVGIGSTLGHATGLPPVLFVGLVFAVAVAIVRRGSLDATVAVAIVVAAVNLTLILALAVLAVPSIESSNLTRIDLPFVGGRPFEAGLVGSVLGVVLGAFFGHLSVSLCGRQVLRREPTGRALVRGVVAAQVTALGVYCVWVLAVGGAVDGRVLAAESGTALVPLADRVGPLVSVLGSVYIVLGMGMATVHYSLALFNLTRERLPGRPEPVVVLPRRGGSLLLTERRPGRGRAPVSIRITYLGLDGGSPRFRLDVDLDGRLHRLEAAAEDPWALLGDGVLSPLTRSVPGLADRGLDVMLDILESSPGGIRVRVTSSLQAAWEPDRDGLGAGLAELLEADEREAEVVAWLSRGGGVGFDEIVTDAGGDRMAAREVLEALLERGLVAELPPSPGATGPRYQAHLAVRRPRTLPDQVWDAMAGDADGADGADRASGAPTATATAGLVPSASPSFARRALAGTCARSVAGLVPLVVVFGAAAWMLATDSGSFSGLIGFCGVIVVSLLAGVYPVLLLASSRRRGEYLSVRGRLRGHPIVLGAIYVLSVFSVFAHGLIIWDDPVRRVGALLAGAGMVVLTVVVWRDGSFRRRLVVEVRAVDDEPADRAYFSMMASGRPAPGRVVLTYADGSRTEVEAAAGQIADYPNFRTATFQPAVAEPTTEVKVWLHHVSFTGDSFPLQARAAIDAAGREGPVPVDVGILSTQAVVPWPASAPGPVTISVTMEAADEPAADVVRHLL